MRRPADQIILVRVGNLSPRILEFLQIFLNESLSVPCEISGEMLDPVDAYSSRRQQYHSTKLIEELLKVRVGEGAKVLGVADVDLYIPIFTFVFGEAQLNNRVALVSVRRLRQEFYGLPNREDLFLARCEKEAIHELGHTFGLVHCRDYECVMHFSNSIEQVDLKSNRFCGHCTQTLLAPEMSAEIA